MGPDLTPVEVLKVAGIEVVFMVVGVWFCLDFFLLGFECKKKNNTQKNLW